MKKDAPDISIKEDITPLAFLNNTTRRFATWDVCISHPRMEKYKYKWENKDRTGEIFRCVLVSIHDPSEYCAAEVRKVKGSPADVLQKAEETYKSGLKFRMSDVELNMKAKPEYDNALCKITIDLTRTKMTKLL